MIPFIDLNTQYQNIKSEIQSAINGVLESGQYIMGKEIGILETMLAEYVGSKHCIAVSSGTDAQLLALMAIGVGPGDEVIVPDFSFFATAEVVELLGATSVFVDIDPKTYNLDPKLLKSKITSKTKAIMPVSLYGRCANFIEINEIAKNHNIKVVEDAAQSFGATLAGKKSCALSDIGCTSFFPSKPLGCYGDGGACFTDDDDFATAMREIRTHGQSKRYYHTRVGTNSRMDTIQAAILIEKLKIFDKEVTARQEVAARYFEGLKDIKQIKLPEQISDTHVYAQFTLELEEREKFADFLKDNDVPTAVHYPFPLSKQPVLLEKYGEISDTPHSVAASAKVISLPMSPYLSLDDQEIIIKVIKKYFS